MNGTALGTDISNRIGRKILVKSLYVRGYCQLDASSALVTGQNVPAQMFRMIILCDLQPNGAVPLVSDLITSPTPYSQLNLNNRDRFKVYVDKQFVVDPLVYNTTATQSVAAFNRTIHGIKKFKRINLETVYNAGTTGLIGDINSGALYMFWIGSIAAGVNDGGFVLSTRVRFLDP